MLNASPELKTTSANLTARRLARLVDELSPPDELAALAVFGRFLLPAEGELANRVSQLSPAANERWIEALALLDGPTGRAAARQIDELAERGQTPAMTAARHFERFLHALDARQRRRRGVYFTPQPLVSFLLRRVRAAIAEHFAGQAIRLIDPACGYGPFLLAAEKMIAGQPLQLLGCEVCPTTWAIANLLLAPTTNHEQSTKTLLLANPLLAGESLREAILGTSDERAVPVIVGNPPWSNFGRQNGGPWIKELLTDYRVGLGERKSNLADDCIKFLRWGQHWIDQPGRGILAFVTPNTWLDGLTHRRMRQSLLHSFDDLLIVDLHGEADRADDENVFGVRSGVAAVVLVKHTSFNGRPPATASTVSPVPEKTVSRHDLHGTRLDKLRVLERDHLSASVSNLLHPAAPTWSFAAPRTAGHGDYDSFWPLDQIFRQYISGVQTKNDAVFVGFTPDEVATQVRGWLAKQGQPAVFDPAFIRPYLVAPFDRRWIYYDPLLIGRARLAVMRHLLRPNLGLVFMRQATGQGQYDHFLAVDALVSDRVFYSRRGAPFLAPLWVDEELPSGVHGSSCMVQKTDNRQSNLAVGFVEAVERKTGRVVDPLELFGYLYAICWCGVYRQRFAEPLRQAFPRIPLPPSEQAFTSLAELGKQLVKSHVLVGAPESGLPPAEGEVNKLMIGGYDVLQRWQAQRQGRTLSAGDAAYLGQLKALAARTVRLQTEINRVWNHYFKSDGQ